MSPQSYADNREIRSNITLILKYSSIIPFRHINNCKFACLYCGKGFLIFKELKNHVSNIHSDMTEEEIISRLKTPKNLIKADISDLKCRLCKETIKSIELLADHLVKSHNKIYFYKTVVQPCHGILPFDFSSENFKCFICNKEFRFFKNLSMHMNEHSSNFMCHFCGKNFVSDHRLQTHIILHKNTDVVCKICGKEFKTVSAMKYHVRKIHKELKYKCSECNKQFAQSYHRLKHLVDCHKLKKPEFKCTICGKELASSGGLSAHIRYSHLKTTQYSCEVCGKTFVYKWIWQRHLDLHSGTKNFECKFCNKKFAKPYTLQMHVRIHLNDKRFVCHICKAAFIQKCSLKNHFKVHHPDENADLGKCT